MLHESSRHDQAFAAWNELLAEFPCWCGSENCRGTLLAAKPEKKKKKKKKSKSAKKDGVKTKASGKDKKAKSGKADEDKAGRTGKKAGR